MIDVLRPLPSEKLKLLVFDLDGTLIDSEQDLCNSVNATLGQFARPPLPHAVVAGYIGDGAQVLVRRAFYGLEQAGIDEELLTRAYACFLDVYRQHKLDNTRVYAGVEEALAELAALAPWSMSVLTNKPVRPAREICEALGLAPFFRHIYGGNSFPMKKPDPMGLRALMVEAGALPEETGMIGDSEVDVLTARNAGAWSVGCTFGLAPRSLDANPPDVLVDSPREWMAALCPAAAGTRR